MKESLQDAGAGSDMAYDAETKGSGGKDNEKQPPAGKGWFKRWRPRLPIVLGGLLALAVLSVWGAKVTLAKTDSPEYCLSCHVMENHYESWFHSAHHLAATCSDCHVPHQNTASKLVAKGIDGLRDSYYFYTNQVPDPIQLSDRGSKIVRENCLRCHGNLMEKVENEDRDCWECHRSVPHGY